MVAPQYVAQFAPIELELSRFQLMCLAWREPRSFK
jgi:hypothetical protein